MRSLSRGVPFQRCVSLAQRKVVPTPVRQECVFHVEHAPIEESTASSRTLLEKFVNLRVDDLGWKLFCKVRDAGGCGATHTPLGITARRTNSERYGSRQTHGLRGHDEVIRSVRDEGFAAPGTEGSAATEEKSRFQQAGLARSIRTDKEIRLWIELQLDRCQAPEPLGAKGAEGHKSGLIGASASRRTARWSRPARAQGSSSCRRLRRFPPRSRLPPPAHPAGIRH